MDKDSRSNSYIYNNKVWHRVWIYFHCDSNTRTSWYFLSIKDTKWLKMLQGVLITIGESAKIWPLPLPHPPKKTGRRPTVIVIHISISCTLHQNAIVLAFCFDCDWRVLRQYLFFCHSMIYLVKEFAMCCVPGIVCIGIDGQLLVSWE